MKRSSAWKTQRVLKLVEEGVSKPLIAVRLGINYTTVLNILKAGKIK